MRISIIICTFNRSSLLKRAIASLMAQSIPSNEYEIIIIDNNSTDNTRQIVTETIRIAQNNIFYFHEPEQGLSLARNRGIREARGEIVAFLDDDALADYIWLEKLLEGFSSERTACVGGRVTPFWDKLTGWPGWLHSRLIGFYTVVNYGDCEYLHYPNYPAGTNIAFRKAAFAVAGNFNAALGRTGQSLLSMEEADICLRIEQAGYQICYCPEAIVQHLVPEERLTKAWLKERSHWQGISSAILELDRFGKTFIITKSFKYLAFTFFGAIGIYVFRIIRDEKKEFFCRCQIQLCMAYLKRIWLHRCGGSPGR